MKPRISTASRWGRTRAQAAGRLALVALVAAALPASCRAIVGIESGDPFVDPSFADGGTDAGDTDAGDTDAEPTLSCESYCAQVADACKDDKSVYPTPEACAALCPHLTLGEATDMSVDSVGCRFRVAKSISSDGETDLCPAVGPGGNGLCGSNCDAYCALMLKVCANQPGAYADLQTCMSACAEVPDLGDYHVVSTDLPNDFSIQCRLRHVNSAAIDLPEVHCMHAVGVMKCGPPADAGAD